jgi:hypothetical protein
MRISNADLDPEEVTGAKMKEKLSCAATELTDNEIIFKKYPGM